MVGTDRKQSSTPPGRIFSVALDAVTHELGFGRQTRVECRKNSRGLHSRDEGERDFRRCVKHNGHWNVRHYAPPFVDRGGFGGTIFTSRFLSFSRSSKVIP